MLASQKDAITKITGTITPESIDELENELGGAFTILKSKHFAQGERYGHLAIVIPEAKYRVVIANPTWMYAAPADPGAYAAAALVAGVSAAQRGVRTCLNPTLSRRFPTNDRMLRYKRLPHTVFTDTMFASTVSRQGNKMAQIYSTSFGWARAHRMKRKGEAHETLYLVPLVPL